jgi:hypothetical protein
MCLLKKKERQMAIDNIAYATHQVGTVTLAGKETVVLTLKLPQGALGSYVIFGRVVMENLDGSSQPAEATLTTLGGATVLDKVDIRLAADDSPPNIDEAGGQSISLQATMILAREGSNISISIRCTTLNGLAREAKLFAISVDKVDRL